MKSIQSAALAATLGLAMVIGATAADAAPLTIAPLGAPLAAPAAGEAPLVLVRGGCGWGAHRTWRGYCHLNYGWRGRVRAFRGGWGWRRWGWRRW